MLRSPIFLTLVQRPISQSNDENAGDTATGIESKFTGFIR